MFIVTSKWKTQVSAAVLRALQLLEAKHHLSSKHDLLLNESLQWEYVQDDHCVHVV